MGRQLGAVRFQGKMANVVGYKNPASSKSNNNFLRERVYTVSNPKTQAQAVQRAKVRPAQIFYNGFEQVLNHAFLPSQRASRNRNRFMSLAMRLDEIPDIMKGEAFLPFCQYQISAGALGLDDLTQASNFKQKPAGANYDWAGVVNFTGLRIGDGIEMEPIDTIGAVSEALIENCTGLVEGMELTFLAVVGSRANNQQRIAQVVSFVLDKGNTVTTLGDIMGDYLVWSKDSNDALILGTETDDYEVLSAGVVISARAGNTYVYTNSKMCMSWRAEDVYSLAEEYVIASYMAGESSTDSDLILQQARNKAIGNRVVPSSISQIEITLADGVSGTLTSQNAGIVTMTNGSKRILVENVSGQICDYDADNGFYVPVFIIPEGDSARPLTLADTAFKGNETITVKSLQDAGFNIAPAPSSTAILFSVSIGGTDLNRGDVYNMVDYSSSMIDVTGLYFSEENLYMKNLVSGSHLEPMSFHADSATFVIGEGSESFGLYVNGAEWAQFIPREPRP